MDQCTSQTRIQNFFEKELQEELREFIEHCKSGDLQSFEDNLWQFTLGIYNSIASLVLNLSNKELEEELREKAKAAGLRKLESRPVSVQIRTGLYLCIGKNIEG